MDCSICFDEIKEEDKKKINCNHVFHEECINKWFKRSHKCPLCRKSKFYISLKEYEKNYWERVRKTDELIKSGNRNLFRV
jgi:hypothetical protein